MAKLANLKKEVWNRFKHTQNVFFATCEGEKPRVRPVSMVHYNKKLWITTGTKDAKVKQIKKNNNIEFCYLFKGGKNYGYIRGSGKAKIVQSKRTKKLVADNVPFFKNYWKSADDPNFTLLNLRVKTMEYLKPGRMKIERISM